ncbi:hypothetical protein [Caviibacter abscessus]|uniref:hypothetical protein n=1 Tax=Caviibacter abscessus TaxID=1766719 RepID=UPI00082A9CF9|nr:hypothetical protein [Caviibacter abscessus]
MYSFGEEFTYSIDDNLEYFTCLNTIEYDDKEYIIAENEYGIKKVFECDEDEEEIYMVDEEEEDTILDIYERNIFERDQPNINYGLDDDEDDIDTYDSENDGLSVIIDEDEQDFESEKIHEENYEDDEEEVFEDMDDFIDDFFEDEDDEK